MCLILFALNDNPKYKLILAANRDEFFNRPTLTADYWEENDSILGGRDVKSKGTWLGINKSGRFIAITNYRDPENERKDTLSRGELSNEFLNTEIDISSFVTKISKDKNKYNGYNLLLSDDSFENFHHYSNVSDQLSKIKNGIHGLSNHLLNTPWPKVLKAKNSLKNTVKSKNVDIQEMIEILKNADVAPENSLPQTGISFDLEKKLSPVFISMKGYGTRCSTAILVSNNNDVTFKEVSYNEKMKIISEKEFDIQLNHK